MALTQEKIYTVEDLYALSDGQRAELIVVVKLFCNICG